MRFAAILTLAITCLSVPARGEKILVQVFGLDNRPLPGVSLSAMGANSTTAPSDVAGRTEMVLAPGTVPGSWISLYLVRPQASLAIFAPVDGKAMVPLNASQAQNYVAVWVCKPGDTKIIGDLRFIVSAASSALEITGVGTGRAKTTETDLKNAMAAVAKKYGISPEQLDRAIHQSHDKTNDPYEQGVLALFEQRYIAAREFLEQALKQSEERKDPTAVLHSCLFLGHALFMQGEYRRAAEIYQKAAALRPDDSSMLTGFGLSLTNIRDYSGAERLFRQALAQQEKELGPDNPELARPLTNLFFVLNENREFGAAAPILQRALPLWERLVGPQDPRYAVQLSNLITVLSNKGDYLAAIPYAKKRIGLCKQSKGEDNIECAVNMGDLATLYYNGQDYTGAEPPLTEALGIFERKLSTEDPNIVACYRKLARVLEAKGDMKGAEYNYRKALDLLTASRSSDSPDLVPILIDLAELLERNRNYAASAREYRRVLTIRKKTLPPDHRNVATALSNLGLELFDAGDYAGAESPLKEALPLQEKHLGVDNPVVLLIRNTLAKIQESKGGTGR